MSQTLVEPADLRTRADQRSTQVGPSRHSSPAVAAVLALQRSAGNAAVAHYLGQRPGGHSNRPAQVAVQRCGPTACDCSAEERADYAAEHGEPLEGEPPIQRETQVQRAGSEAVQIDALPASTGSESTGAEKEAEEQAGGGQAVDSNNSPVLQRQSAPIGVQRISRQEEINLSMSSPGRAVMDPTRPSLSLFNFGIDRPESADNNIRRSTRRNRP